jgi:glutamine amidotransferase
MGWNELEFTVSHPVLAGLPAGAHAYFVHSYAFAGAVAGQVMAQVDYGGKVVAIVGRDNMIGTQFHPEKSQRTGLTLIRNFLNWSP